MSARLICGKAVLTVTSYILLSVAAFSSENVRETPVDCVFCYHLIILRKNAGDEVEVAYVRGNSRRSCKVTLAKPPKPSLHGMAIRKFGFDVERLTLKIAEALYIDADDGLLVSKVIKGGPAADRGIDVGDVIVQLGEYRVRTLEDAAIILDRINSGDTITFGFIRGQYIIRTRLTAR